MNKKEANTVSTAHRESFTELLGQLANNSAAVFHDEIELVIQGIHEKVAAVRSGALTVVIGAAISFTALMSLCAALIIELASYMDPVIAALAVGVVLAFIGVSLAFIGYKKMKHSKHQ